MKLTRALLIVDVQNDFLPGGALGVVGGEIIIPVVNKYIKFFAQRQLPIFISRDWHPAKTKHFKSFGGIWPKHCVQNTKGAQFHPTLRFPKEAIILSKGMDPEKDSYSVFQAQDHNGTDFLHLLKIFGITEVYIAGLATDYCVRWSTLDALREGFKVMVLSDAIKGVNLKHDDSKNALDEITSRGARQMTFDTICKHFRRKVKNGAHPG
jgi:nicotinamidase/pyrazinamidase